MLPDRDGLYHAYPANIGIDETGANELATCIINFHLFEELIQGQWVDRASENLDITGYFYLEKRDGTLNTAAIDSLKAALGWDGRDPFWLQETDLAEHPVQVKLGYEEYDGKTRLKVRFLNPYGAAPGGGVSKADAAARKAISTRLGSKLRALAGGAPAQAPKPSGRPAPKSKAPAAPAQPSASSECTLQEAWAAFCDAYDKAGPQEGTAQDRERQWFEILQQLFPGRDVDSLKPVDWAVARAEAVGKIVPF